MDETLILQLVKDSLGIRTNIRDNYLKAIIAGVVEELENEKGIELDSSNPSQIIFIADYASWRYENRGNDTDLPRHLKFRLNNLIIHYGGGSSDI